jgi:phosphoribosylamine-glycine ligase
VNKQHNDNFTTGSCGREHALAWKMLQSSKCSKLFVAQEMLNIKIAKKRFFLNILDFDAIKTFALAEKWIWLLLDLKILWFTEFMISLKMILN